MWKPGEKPDTPCDEWDGYLIGKGYGELWVGGRHMLAHRLVWMQDHGHVDPRTLIMHKCDNPKCVRLDHLQVGTFQQNADDMAAKKRGRKPQEFCHKGHRIEDDFVVRSDGKRRCGICYREYHAEYQRKTRNGKVWRPGGPGRKPGWRKDGGVDVHRPDDMDAEGTT